MVTHEELYKIAALAKLSLEGEDMDALLADMSGIIGFANAVSEAPLSASGAGDSGEVTVLREDDVTPSFPAELLLKNAPARSDNFFLARGKRLEGHE